jgi:hypothetical protein
LGIKVSYLLYALAVMVKGLAREYSTHVDIF